LQQGLQRQKGPIMQKRYVPTLEWLHSPIRLGRRKPIGLWPGKGLLEVRLNPDSSSNHRRRHRDVGKQRPMNPILGRLDAGADPRLSGRTHEYQGGAFIGISGRIWSQGPMQ